MISSRYIIPSLWNRALYSKHRLLKDVSFSTATTDKSKTVVIVDGVRLPFAMSSTIYEDQMAVDLQRIAFKALMDKTALDRKVVDYIIAGTVIQEVRTSNIAREAAVNAGFPNCVGAHTVSMVRWTVPLYSLQHSL